MTPRTLINVLDVLRATRAGAEALRSAQARRLARLVRHAYANVPHYRRLLDAAGIAPGDIRGPDDLPRLPETSRTALQALPLADRTPDPGVLQRHLAFTTSGSTGVPLTVHVSASDWDVNQALTLRALVRFGLRPWHRKLSIRGSAHQGRDTSLNGRLGVFRRVWMSADGTPDEWFGRLAALRPDLVMGYYGTLQLMARAVRERGGLPHAPRLLVPTGGFLERAAREEIAAGFGGRVRDLYGSWEGGMMAWECAACGGYHVNADWVILEILKDGRPALPGEVGDVVVTNLHSFGMPFIRYRQGDLASWSTRPSVCGCRLPLIERVYGRSADLLHLPGGRTLSPHLLLILMDRTPGVLQWRLVQLEPTRFRVEVVPAPAFDAAEPALRQGLQSLLGVEARVEIARLRAFADDGRGKHRYVVSEVDGRPDARRGAP